MCRFWNVALLIWGVVLVAQQFPPTMVDAFNAHLVRPWNFKRGQLRIRTRKKSTSTQQQHESNAILVPVSTDTAASSAALTAMSSSSSTSHETAATDGDMSDESKESNKNPNKHEHEHPRMTPPLLETSNSSFAALQGSAHASTNIRPFLSESKKQQPPTSWTAGHSKATVWSQIGPLTKRTRPQNFPGIFCFHVIGIYIALQSADRMDMFFQVLLGKPAMWLVLSCVMLVSSTSVSIP